MKTTKLLLTTIALLLCSVMANAHDFEVDGIFYNILSSTDLTVEVTYIGQHWNSYEEYSGVVIIPSSVTYNGRTYSVTSIGGSAFYGCYSLTSVTIPNSVTSIGHGAFEGCSSLTSVTIPNSVTSIGWHAFDGCSSLNSVTIPNSVTSIGSSAFSGCSSLTSVTIPNSVTSIEDYAFYGCSSLNSVTIPNSVTSIGDYAFYKCSSLTSITIPESVTSIEDYAFYGCSSLTKTNYTGDIAGWCNIKFYSSMANPMYCSHNFYINDQEIKDLVIPNSVTSIGNYAFYGCSSLTSITIPNSVTSIGSYAFSGCSSATSVTINSDAIVNKAYTSSSNISNIFGSQVTKYIIGDNVKGIGDYAFYGCSSLISITITNSVTSIGSYAFKDCSSLTSVTIPNSVTSIGSSAFYGCSSLNSVTIPNSVTSIGSSAFYGCYSLNSITIPNSVTSIGNYAFEGCSSLTKTNYTGDIAGWCNIEFDNGFANPMYYSHNFYINDQEIKDLVIPNNVTSIGSYAFRGCSSLTSITIPNSVTSIGSSAFYGCYSATSVTINSDAIVNKAYTSSSNISNIFGSQVTKYIIGDNVKGIGDYAFYGCSSLISITITNSVTSIGSYAFNKCSSLTSITIPNSVTSIGSSAFYGCSNLRSLTIGAGVLSIGSSQSTPAKVIWLPNTPPSGYGYLAGTINYIPNDQYSLTNAYIYPFLSSMFETDGVKYIPISPSERTCDVIDCIYDSTNLKIAIDSTVIFQGVEMKTKNIMPYAFCKNDFIREVSLGNSGNIERLAFENCSNLQTATISNSGDIGTSAFENCSNLQTATISNSGDIGTSAFKNCSNLRIANISNIGTIGSDAFKGCSSLTTAGLGDSIKALGDNAFYQCSSLQAITIPNSVESVGKYCFSGCSNMISAVIGDGLATIKDYTFQHCSALESLIIGNHVTTIETYAFENCSSLEKITFPQSIISVTNNVFKGCTSLADIIIEDRSTKLELGSNGSSPLFADCPLDSVYIGGKITYNTSKNSGYSPFYRNTSLRTITITDQEEQIYENEFYGCTNLKNVTIGHGIKNIGERAFSGCSSLDKFSFGSNVESIGAEAFSDCVNMTQIISSASIPPVCGTQALDDINKWSCVLKVPQNYKAAYQTAEQWKEFFFIEDVVEVKKFAVIYMIDNETFAIDSLSVGEVIITIEEPTKEGYTFSGWNEVPEIMPAEDIVIDGYFSVNYYALKYTVDDEPYAVDSVAYGAVIELREKPKRDDYEFIGWSEAPETMPAHDIEVYGNFIFTSVTDVQVDPEPSQKVIEDNQLFIILPNGKKYNAMGQEM